MFIAKYQIWLIGPLHRCFGQFHRGHCVGLIWKLTFVGISQSIALRKYGSSKHLRELMILKWQLPVFQVITLRWIQRFLCSNCSRRRHLIWLCTFQRFWWLLDGWFYRSLKIILVYYLVSCLQFSNSLTTRVGITYNFKVFWVINACNDVDNAKMWKFMQIS